MMTKNKTNLPEVEFAFDGTEYVARFVRRYENEDDSGNLWVIEYKASGAEVGEIGQDDETRKWYPATLGQREFYEHAAKCINARLAIFCKTGY